MPIPADSVVLLGAGASKEAGAPLTFEMTQVLVERIAARQRPQLASALNFVCGALIAHDAAAGASPYKGLDVERAFAAKRDNRQGDDLRPRLPNDFQVQV